MEKNGRNGKRVSNNEIIITSVRKTGLRLDRPAAFRGSFLIKASTKFSKKNVWLSAGKKLRGRAERERGKGGPFFIRKKAFVRVRIFDALINFRGEGAFAFAARSSQPERDKREQICKLRR